MKPRIINNISSKPITLKVKTEAFQRDARPCFYIEKYWLGIGLVGKSAAVKLRRSDKKPKDQHPKRFIMYRDEIGITTYYHYDTGKEAPRVPGFKKKRELSKQQFVEWRTEIK